jgi:cell filamentation protein
VSDDPYVYPGTDVLRNELGIRDAGELRRVESDLTYWRALRLATTPIPGSYDLAHLQACHRALFAGLYAWAGQLRTVRIAKADVFCLPQFIEPSACEIFARLAREQHLVGLARNEFIDRLATYLGDVNALHPFREGNGRAQRVFFGQLANEAGHRLRWELVDAAHNVTASIASTRGDLQPLHELLNEIVAPLA